MSSFSTAQSFDQSELTLASSSANTIFEDKLYRVALASDVADLRAVQRLRYLVFKTDIRNTDPIADVLGYEADAFDDQCQHIMVIEKNTAQVIGTYRYQTAKHAANGLGFYSDQEFDMDHFPRTYSEKGLELGRACIAEGHRNGRVLYLLWKALMYALLSTQSRYIFGCCSIPTTNPLVGLNVMHYLTHQGHMHPSVRLIARSGYICSASFNMFHKMNRDITQQEEFKAIPELPVLMQKYLDMGAKVCSVPALDRSFKSIDFMILLDRFAIDPSVFNFFKRGLPIAGDQILPSLY
jgi:putative hemolysin